MLSLRLFELRNQKGLSQKWLAQYLQITPQAYSLYETNKRQMNYESLCLLADFYNVTADYLLGREAAKNENLTEEERDIVGDYRLLDSRGKAAVKALLVHELSQQEKPAVKKPAG